MRAISKLNSFVPGRRREGFCDVFYCKRAGCTEKQTERAPLSDATMAYMELRAAFSPPAISCRSLSESSSQSAFLHQCVCARARDTCSTAHIGPMCNKPEHNTPVMSLHRRTNVRVERAIVAIRGASHLIITSLSVYSLGASLAPAGELCVYKPDIY